MGLSLERETAPPVESLFMLWSHWLHKFIYTQRSWISMDSHPKQDGLLLPYTGSLDLIWVSIVRVDWSAFCGWSSFSPGGIQ